MRSYTRTGDDGTTGLIGGARARKNSLRIDAIGEVDELNAAIGLARAADVSGPLDQELELVQNWLFDLGAELASPERMQYRALSRKQVEMLEMSIDRQTAESEPLQAFILPGGAELAARLHFARCVCRRAERSILELDARESLSEDARAFMNRLSDWLFVAARTANRLSGVQDVKWRRTGE